MKRKFEFLRAFISPFKFPKPKFYIGKVSLGTPYFLPRKWIRHNSKPGYLTPVPKKIGFDLVGLGYKVKWSNTDYIFEWSPIWSFVFFGIQIAIIWVAPHQDKYWESWLYFTRHTDKNKSYRERIDQCKKEFPQTYTRYIAGNSKGITIDYYSLIVKTKYK